MFIRSKAKGYSLSLNNSSKYSALYFGEKCSVCEEEQPEDKNVIRHNKSNNIICITCISAIADMN